MVYPVITDNFELDILNANFLELYNQLNVTQTQELTSSSLSKILTHEIRKKSGICQYKLNGCSGTWLANTIYTVATLPIGYRPSTAIGKTINLRIGVLGYLHITEEGVIQITPHSDISAKSIRILETFLSA